MPMSFSPPSLDRLSDVLGDVAAAGAGEQDWLPALDALVALMHGSTVTTFLQRRADKALEWVHQCGQHAPGGAYVDHYAKQDVLLPSVLKRPPGNSLSNSQLVAWSDFKCTEFYVDFAKPRDMIDCIHVRLFDDPVESVFFAVTRSHVVGVFEDADRALVDLLAPHLARALRNSRRLAVLVGERDVAHASLAALRGPILITDSTLRIHYANPAAESILRVQDPLSCRDGSLVARRPGDTDALRRLVTREVTSCSAWALEKSAGGAATGSALALHRNHGSPVLLRVLPLRPGHKSNPIVGRAAMIVIVDPDRIEQPALASCLRALYGLTAAEARVAAYVGGGTDPGTAAESLGMKRTTVRWYLQRIFEKTETARQSELVRLVERLGVAHSAG